ncbi:MAG: hypothetical protein ABIE07_06185 [Candidatus Zixiibacteriota bacterium]
MTIYPYGGFINTPFINSSGDIFAGSNGFEVMVDPATINDSDWRAI